MNWIILTKLITIAINLTILLACLEIPNFFIRIQNKKTSEKPQKNLLWWQGHSQKRKLKNDQRKTMKENYIDKKIVLIMTKKIWGVLMTKVFEELIYGWFFWSLLYGPP